jgi:hypothetical protein
MEISLGEKVLTALLALIVLVCFGSLVYLMIFSSSTHLLDENIQIVQ